MRLALRLLVTAAFAFLAIPLASAQLPITGIWEFDETSGMVAADFGPNANNATLVNFTNDPAQWVPGVRGNALEFDGVDDYVTLAPVGGLPFYTGLGASFTICVWINGYPTDDDRIISLGSSASTTPVFTFGTGYTSSSTSDKLRLYARNAENISSVVLSDTTVFDTTWHHIAYVETSGRARLYVDGVQDTAVFDDRWNRRGPRSTTHGTYPFDLIGLGCVLRSSTCCFYSGWMDSLQIYGCELTQTDIVSVMNGALPANCAASLGEYGPGCGPGPFELLASGFPALGSPGILFTMRGGHPSASASLCLAPGTLVPLDLGPLGYAGCTLYTSGTSCFSLGPLSPYGSSLAGFAIPIPSNLALAGLQINFQAMAFSAGGIDLSNAVVSILGL